MSALAAAWPQALCVMAGAALGGLLRWFVALWLNPLWNGLALGTLMVNAVGGLAIGMAAAWFSQRPNELLHLLLVTGVLGGFTTFSAFSVESLLLLQRGALWLAAVHTLVHVLGALAAAALGWAIGQAAVAAR